MIYLSGYFNKKWYSTNYPGFEKTKKDPITHYLRFGGFNGYDPSHLFNSRDYLQNNSDVRAMKLNPLVHYLRFGKKEGRDISPGTLIRKVTDFEWISYAYKAKFGKPLRTRNPKGFNEKIQAYKLYFRDRDLSNFVDKYTVRDFVKNNIGLRHLIPLIGVYENVDEINIDVLPNQFAMKATHGSGWNIICKNKQEIDWDLWKKKLSNWLSSNYYDISREWAYKQVQPKIIVEELLVDKSGNSPRDYKFFCFSGEPRFIQVDYNRSFNHERTFFDLQWNYLPVSLQYPINLEIEKKPSQLDHMLKIAQVLSTGFPFVRIDLYAFTEIFFGEMTFYPGSGFKSFNPKQWDKFFGKQFIDLSFLSNRKSPGD